MPLFWIFKFDKIAQQRSLGELNISSQLHKEFYLESVSGEILKIYLHLQELWPKIKCTTVSEHGVMYRGCEVVRTLCKFIDEGTKFKELRKTTVLTLGQKDRTYAGRVACCPLVSRFGYMPRAPQSTLEIRPDTRTDRPTDYGHTEALRILSVGIACRHPWK